ncbi:AMP-binding protein [Pseudonocardia sp. TRM90224]|uniref:AMP-binding protein n=1 Tax=Pseudonocardia sp. TRM90224 TaxID=2812678 RepID=UPI001E31F36D|nr:AMP-binding protein [Pseudonocardia sp. TRM90224]
MSLPDNFASQFELIADLAPTRPAVAAGDRALTWGQFDELADRLAAHLTALGIGADHRVGLAARNSPEYLVALHALFKLRATPINVNYRYRAAEVRHLLESAGARGVIADAELSDVVGEAAARLPAADVLVEIAADGGFGPAVAAAPRHPRRPRGDAEWLLFTGGTTGYPKAVIGSHTERLRAVRSGGFTTLGIDPAAGVEALHQALDIDPHGPSGLVHLPASPLMHGTGLYSALGTLAVGAPVALLPGRSTTGADLVAAIERHRVTDLTIVGDAFAVRLLDALDAGGAAAIGSLRRIRSVGAVWSPPVKRRLLAYADVTLLDTIAASEGGVYAVATITRATADDQAGTFTLAPGARLLDPDGHDVEPGSDTVGLLAAPVVADASYEGDAEKTANAFQDIDGVRYSIPGDMALLGADGRLHLLGRGSSVINTGGEKVYADEVELVLRDHPAVRDVVVLGVPDPKWGSAVGAVVALEAGVEATAADLAAFVAARLAGYKKPRRIALVPEVERLNTGKADLRWAGAQFPAAVTQ